MRKHIVKYAPRIVFILFLLSFGSLFYFSSPDTIIAFLGVENAFVIIFVLAIIGGLSTFSGVPYHLVLVTLATGGVNPFWLGLCAAAGVMIGDATSYLIGYSGREIIPIKIQKWLDAFYAYGMKHPRLMPVAFFVYGSVSPFSNDFIVISAGLAKYPFWKVMTPLALGNVIFNISLAYFAGSVYTFLQGWIL